uniref:Uncharacterized protein n=1 Tax=Chromera velia CCMP2878 TaxID=1169474 RepID=A0A0G4H9K2_9ALVE|eukprot:Cvel_25431.t1-p1 / transcript=Cvel_25431.t1 / gene=Cvel_25431 / organism=Chromera_velia_CCMP2878 / gene_product=hypothetical protein / transcript_product=hypothetical protein / location=Cvel_scaffold2880:14285-16531(+) / protein_length=264 / sequence_SO=supercontig / SO=protein_coding / is_pseudo=false
MRTPSPTRRERRPFEVFGDASSAGALEEEAREEDRDGGGSTYTGEAVGAGIARRRREEAMDDPMMMKGGEWFTGGEMEEERANREVQLQADIVLTHDRTVQAGELAEAAREAIRQQEYLNVNRYLDEAEALMQSISRVIENKLPLPYVDLQPGSNGFIMMQQVRESRENLEADIAEGQSWTTAAAAAASAAAAPAAASATASSPSAEPPHVRGRDSELYGAGTVLPSSRFSLAGASEVAKRIVSDGRGKEAKFDPVGGRGVGGR